MAEAPTRAEVAAELRSWLGTRWMHGVALKGYRTDCVQYLIAVARQFGWLPSGYEPPRYRRDYSLHNDYPLLRRLLAEVAEEILLPAADVGDVLIFVNGRTVGHAGMYLGDGLMVHGHVHVGVMLAPWYSGVLDSVWRFRAKQLREVA